MSKKVPQPPVINKGRPTRRFYANENLDLSKHIKVTKHLLNRSRHVSVQAKWLFVVLRSFLWDNKGDEYVYPSYRTLVEMSGLSRNSVTDAIKELVKWDLLRIQHTEGRVNRYTFHYPTLCDAETQEEVADADQTYPSKEQAKAYRKQIKSRRRNEY